MSEPIDEGTDRPTTSPNSEREESESRKQFLVWYDAEVRRTSSDQFDMAWNIVYPLWQQLRAANAVVGDIELGHAKIEADLRRTISELRTKVKRYDELIYAVVSKYPNETRHQTALRYIRERESNTSTGQSAALTEGREGK